MHAKTTLLGKPTAAFSGFLIFFMLISMAAASPSFPYELYGSATINGRAVPSGSAVTAEIDGIVRGAVTVSEDGIYGKPVFKPKLVVENGNNGDTIVFYVQTPQMSNRLQAAETAVYSVGGGEELDLTFTGEEIPKPSGGSSSDDSGGSGDSGGSTPPEQGQAEPAQGAVKDLDISNLEPAGIELANKDTVNIIIGDSSYSIQLKSMSDFSVLLDHQGKSVVLGLEETKEIDLNGDYVTDVAVTLESIEDGKAFLTFTALEKDAVSAGFEGVTGYATANPLIPGIITIIVIGALGISALRFRRRGSL
jgi:hypothetical protein